MVVIGYNIGMKIGGKTILGRTQDDLKITSVIKESITKDDEGVKNSVVTGHEVSFTVAGEVMINNGVQTSVDRDALLAMSLLTGTQAEIPFTYACVGGRTLTGICVITDFSESSNSEDNATYNINCKSTGPVTLST